MYCLFLFNSISLLCLFIVIVKEFLNPLSRLSIPSHTYTAPCMYSLSPHTVTSTILPPPPYYYQSSPPHLHITNHHHKHIHTTLQLHHIIRSTTEADQELLEQLQLSRSAEVNENDGVFQLTTIGEQLVLFFVCLLFYFRWSVGSLVLETPFNSSTIEYCLLSHFPLIL